MRDGMYTLNDNFQSTTLDGLKDSFVNYILSTGDCDSVNEIHFEQEIGGVFVERFLSDREIMKFQLDVDDMLEGAESIRDSFGNDMTMRQLKGDL